jgi:hypothetical protein
MWIDDMGIGFLIVLCTAIPVCVLVALVLCAHCRGQRLRAAVLGVTLIHEIVLTGYPGLYEAITKFRIEKTLEIAPYRLLMVYIGEAVFVILFSFMLSYGGNNPNRERNRRPTSNAFLNRDNIFLSFLVIAAAGLYAGQFLNPTLDYQDLANHYQIANNSTLSAYVIDWGGTVVRWPGLFAAGFVVVNRSVRRIVWIAGVVVLFAELVYSMVNGTRGGVVWVVSAIGMAGYYKHNKRLLVWASILTFALLPLLSWMHTNMRYVTLEAPQGTKNWMMMPALIEGIIHREVLESSSVGSSFAEAWAIRAAGPLDSTVLYGLYDKGDAAYLRPILGAMLLPIPHTLWSDKPMAGSTDSTNLGSAIYRVQQEKPDSAFYDMGPVLASAHAYWEGGWIWLCVAALMTGWIWNKLFAWAEHAQSDSVAVIVLVFTAGLPIDGFFTALTPIFAYVRLLWIALLPLSLILMVLKGRMRRNDSSGPTVAIELTGR